MLNDLRISAKENIMAYLYMSIHIRGTRLHQIYTFNKKYTTQMWTHSEWNLWMKDNLLFIYFFSLCIYGGTYSKFTNFSCDLFKKKICSDSVTLNILSLSSD